MAETEPVKIKQARVLILSTLNLLCPTAVLARRLYRTVLAVDPRYNDDFFAKDIWYLREKGLVEFANEPIGGSDELLKKFIKLTASGKEIAEKTATDSALDI